MAALFPDHPEALQNTLKIAERCNVDFEFGHFHLPNFDLPQGYWAESYLDELVREPVSYTHLKDMKWSMQLLVHPTLRCR